MNKYKALIVDDESLARNIIKNYLSERNDIEIIAECSDGFECLKLMSTNKIDILFLDIQMPKITGFELLEVISEKPEIIFTTAYDEFALKAFETNAVDYLLKPFSKERFNNAINKSIERINNRTSHNEATNIFNENFVNEKLSRIVVKSGNKVNIISVEEIIYIESNENYVNIHANQGIFVKEKTMTYYEQNLPETDFIRLHRSFIANINYINSIEPYTRDTYIATMRNSNKIQVSREGYKKFRERYS